MPYLRRYARGLPQSLHLLYALTLNFGGLFAFSIKQVFAIRHSIFVFVIDYSLIVILFVNG
jgi:hypothetical protein